MREFTDLLVTMHNPSFQSRVRYISGYVYDTVSLIESALKCLLHDILFYKLML